MVPEIYAKVPMKVRNTRTVEDAILHSTWARDVGPDMNEGGPDQSLKLWIQVKGTSLDAQRPDQLM